MLARLIRLLAVLSGSLTIVAAFVSLLGNAPDALAAPSATRNYPGAAPCNTTLQACIDGSGDGDEIVIASNTYVTSVNVSRNLRLRGVSSATTILQALPGDRVMTVTAPFNAGFRTEIMSLTLRGGAPVGGQSGALRHNSASPLLVSRVLITGNIATPGAGGGMGTAPGAGAATLEDVRFVNNTGGGLGGAILAASPLTIVRGVFERNLCTGIDCKGGAIYAHPAAPIVLSTSAVFTANTAKQGGAIAALGPLTVSAAGLNALRFEANQALGAGALGGGGAIVAQGALVLKATTFVSNSAVAHGGALLISGTVVAKIGGGAVNDTVQFNRNRANLSGGAAAVVGGSTLDHQGRVDHSANSASSGGALYIGPGAQAIIALTAFNHNTATVGSGGAILNDGTLLMEVIGPFGNPLSFEGNSAATEGGAIATLGTLSVTVQGSDRRVRLEGNAAGGYGGALYSRTPLAISGWDVLTNTAVGDGGGFYFVTAAVLTDTLIQANHSQGNGGGASVNGLTLVRGSVIGNSASNGGGIHATQLLDTGGSVEFAPHFAGGTSPWTDAPLEATQLLDAALPVGIVLDGVSVTGNIASVVGGGIYGGQPILLTGTHFISNLGGIAGGGLVALATLDATGGEFAFNRTGNCTFLARGGALFLASDATLRNLAVRGNGSCDGGGAYVIGGETRILGGVWSDNSALGLGGALFYTGTPFLGPDSLGITATQFISNRALNGGGLFLRGADAQLVNTLLARNTATGGTVGAAVASFVGGVRILNTTITDRVLNAKDAINISSGTVNISNTVIASHTLGIRKQAGIATEDYNLFFGNTTNTAGVVTGTHSLVGDPRFANPAGDDYRLTTGSAAINAGFNFGVATDFEDNPRTFGGAPDIGYDEFARQVYLPFVAR